MMGHQPEVQQKLFYTKFSLDQRIPKDHILRKFTKYIDFDFIYKEVKDTYGIKGNVSIPPPVILKLMVLLTLYNVRSERELMATIPMRLDWLWFLDYDLDDEIPNHSVLSKARARRGKGKSKLEYQIHRGVDPKCEVITTTEVTPGEVHEAHRLQPLPSAATVYPLKNR